MNGNSSRPLATHSGWMKLRFDSQDAFGVVHVDYNADLFDIMLHYLRTGRLVVRNNTVEDILGEADYWRLPGLVELCRSKLRDRSAGNDVKDMSVATADIESPETEVKKESLAGNAVLAEQRIDDFDANAIVENPVEYTPPLEHSQPLQQKEPQIEGLMKTLAGQSFTLNVPPQKESSDTTREQQSATSSIDVNNNTMPKVSAQSLRFRQGHALLRPTSLRHNIGPVVQKPLTFANLAAASREILKDADRQKADAERKDEDKKGPNDSPNVTGGGGGNSSVPAPPNLQPQRSENVTEKLEPAPPRAITATASPLMRQIFRRGGGVAQFKAPVAQPGPAGGAQQS